MRDCVRRGMRAPVVAIGDGAPGFWTALRDVFPETKEQRCWFRKSQMCSAPCRNRRTRPRRKRWPGVERATGIEPA